MSKEFKANYTVNFDDGIRGYDSNSFNVYAKNFETAYEIFKVNKRPGEYADIVRIKDSVILVSTKID